MTLDDFADVAGLPEERVLGGDRAKPGSRRRHQITDFDHRVRVPCCRRLPIQDAIRVLGALGGGRLIFEHMTAVNAKKARECRRRAA